MLTRRITINMTSKTPAKKNESNTADPKAKKSPLGYLGGKSRLAKRIVERIPPHTCYVEPFCGGAWVYFTKDPSRVEVLNDMDGELVSFWRVIRHHLPEFLRHLEYTLVSREEFIQSSRQDTELLTDVQRAVRYYRLQRMGFGGKTTNRTFGTSSVRPSSFNLERVKEILTQTHRRLARTTIEKLDACECIQKYDAPHTVFYIDPPYWEADFYAVSFPKKDFERLRDTLRNVKGQFILSLNDTPEIRAIFAEFTIESIETKYSLANGKSANSSRDVARKEVLIHNMEAKSSD